MRTLFSDWFRKACSITLSALLIVLMMPALFLPNTAHAGETAGLITAMDWDSHPASTDAQTETQANPVDSIKNAPSGTVTVTLPDLSIIELEDAATAALPAGGTLVAASVEQSSKVMSAVGAPSIAEGSDVLSVVEDKGSWIFTKAKAGSATVTTPVTKIVYTISYKYTESGSAEEKNGKTELTKEDADNASASYGVTVSDIWAWIDAIEDVELDATVALASSDLQELLLIAAPEGFAKQLKGEINISASDKSELGLQNNSLGSSYPYTLLVKPRKAMKSYELEVAWYYPDETLCASQKATIKTVKNSNNLEVDIPQQALRLEADQRIAAAKDIENAFNEKAYKDADSNEITISVNSDELWGESAYAAVTENGGELSINTDAITIDSSHANDYKLLFKKTVIVIAKAEKFDNFSITGGAGAGGSAKNGWFNGKIEIQAKNSQIADSWNSALYVDKYEPTTLQGTNTCALYVKSVDENDSIHDGVITKGDCSFKYDSLKPQYKNFSVSSSEGKSSLFPLDVGSLFYGRSTVTLTMSIADAIPSSNKSLLPGDTYSGMDKSSVYLDKSESSPGTQASWNESLSSYTVQYNEEEKNLDTTPVCAQDLAGNVLDSIQVTSVDEIPNNIRYLVADGDIPEMSVSWTGESRLAAGRYYYDKNVTISFSITDQFFNYTQKYAPSMQIMQINHGGSSSYLTVSDFNYSGSGNVYTKSITFTDEGDYEVTAPSIEDLLGLEGKVSGITEARSFTIDKTAPVMSVDWDNNNASNGKYYAASRTATVTVTEHNFDASLIDVSPTANAGNGDSMGSPTVGAWTDNGDVHVATVSFPGEGVYSLSVSGEDLATNSLNPYSSGEFIVDTIKPVITISGVSNKGAYAGVAQPGVAITDTNASSAGTSCTVSSIGYQYGGNTNPYSESLSSTATEIVYAYPNPASVTANDGVYRINATAVDLAGNTESQACVWSVNRFGSTYVISADTESMLDKYIKPAALKTVQVVEINPSGIEDGSGNPSTTIDLTANSNNSTLRATDDYSVTAGISGSGGDGWHEYAYTMKQDLFSKDGVYRLLFRSVDTAGNVSENTMQNKNVDHSASAAVNFAVDGQAPTCDFASIEEGGLYSEASHKATVTIGDNLMLAAAEVMVDGNTVLKLDANTLNSSSTHSFNIDQSGSKQKVSVKAYDQAGNECIAEIGNVVVSTNPFILWFNNTALFVGSLLVLAALGVGGVFLYKNKRRKKA